MMWKILLAVAITFAVPVFAQTTTDAVVMGTSATSQAAVDPARLAVATRIISVMLPDGTYRKIMTPMFDAMTGQMTDSMMSVPIATFVRATGADESEVKKLGSTSPRDILRIIDPAFEQRNNITMKVIMNGIIDMISGMEPELRQVYARVYARGFELRELREIEAFFKTPAGHAYATRSMVVVTDPEVLAQSKAMMPKIFERLPELMAQAQAATASLPEPRKPQDLSAAEKQRVAQLLGIDLEKVK